MTVTVTTIENCAIDFCRVFDIKETERMFLRFAIKDVLDKHKKFGDKVHSVKTGDLSKCERCETTFINGSERCEIKNCFREVLTN